VNPHLRTAIAATGIAIVAGLLAAYLGADDWLDGTLAAEDTTPPASPPPPVAPEAASSPVNAPWNVDNIRDLKPVRPERSGTVARSIPALPAYDTALATLAPILLRGAGNPENAWAIAHGLLARGADFRLVDGRASVPHLFSVYAEPRAAGSLTLVGFPREKDGAPVEPHSDLLLKSLTEVGVDPAAEFPMDGGVGTAADLYRYTLLKTYLRAADNVSSFDSPGDTPWALQALAAWAPAGPLRWTALDGTEMSLEGLTAFVAIVLTKESTFMFEKQRAGQPFERKGQPLFGYACGGAHLVQGLSYAAGRGYGGPNVRKAVEAQVSLLFYRLPIELEIYDDAMKKSRQHRKKLTVQRMKFLGHWLETMSKMQIMGFFAPDEMQAQVIEGAAQNLTLTIKDLEAQGVFSNLDAIQAEDPQMYLDVVGDSAHAVRGLELALGRQSLAW
jgi:hypothetical protein